MSPVWSLKLAIRALVGGLLVFGAVSAGWSATVPWTTFSEAAKNSTLITSGIGPCPNGPMEVAYFLLEHKGDQWGYWYASDTERLVVAYYPKGADMPSEVGIGRVDPTRADVIPVLTWMAFTESTPGPCQLLRYDPKA